MSTTEPPRAALLVAATLLLALGTGCTTRTEGAAGETSNALPSAAPGPHNPTDEAYAHEMVTMHQQAVVMAQMVGSKDVSGDLRRLAAGVGQARGQQMVSLGYLAQSWGIKPHTGDFHGNPGELTGSDLADLDRLDGEEFEREWLLRVVENYRGSVAMSRAELDRGLSVAGRQYARDVAESLEAQLAELEQAAG